MPSSEQIASADHFFLRGYDLASDEVVGLDNLVEAIGGKLQQSKQSLQVSSTQCAALCSLIWIFISFGCARNMDV